MRRISTSDIIYARVLISLDVPFKAAQNMHHIFQHEPELTKALEDPTISFETKYKIIDDVFEKPVRTYLKVVLNNGMIGDIRAIYNQYKELYFTDKHKVLCYLDYAGEISDAQLEKISQFVMKKFGYVGVEYEKTKDDSLIGGFILRVGDNEFDKSIKGTLERMRQYIVKN